MILLTFQPNIALQTCLTKASAKADNLITAAQTGKLLNVDIHLILEHLWNTRLSGQHGVHAGRTISGDVCGNSAAKEAKTIKYTLA